MPKHNRDIDGYDLPNEEAGLLVVIAVERASEYATEPRGGVGHLFCGQLWTSVEENMVFQGTSERSI